MKDNNMKTIEIALEDIDEQVLNSQLFDIKEWLQGALTGKINNVKTRLLLEAQDMLIEDPEIDTLPASEDGILELYFSRPYYKTRSQRDKDL